MVQTTPELHLVCLSTVISHLYSPSLPSIPPSFFLTAVCPYTSFTFLFSFIKYLFLFIYLALLSWALGMWKFLVVICKLIVFLGGSSGKESACNAGAPGDTGLIPGSGRSPGGGNGNLLQYSCLGNPMDRGAWWATVHGAAKSWTQLKQFSLQHACKLFVVACGI